jgi:hypothetical protein
MIHVVVMKCLTGLPLLMHTELLWRSRSRRFKNRGVGNFVYRLHRPGYRCHDTEPHLARAGRYLHWPTVSQTELNLFLLPVFYPARLQIPDALFALRQQPPRRELSHASNKADKNCRLKLKNIPATELNALNTSGVFHVTHTMRLLHFF